MIVDRRQLRDELARLLALLTRQPAPRLTLTAAPPSRRDRPPPPHDRPPRSPAGSRYLETLHPKAIALGLERVARGARAHGACARAARSSPSPAPTARARRARCWRRCCARAGYRTGLYTSPHLAALQRARAHRRRARRPTPRCVAAFDAVEDARTRAATVAAHLFRVRHAGRAVAVRARAASTSLVLEVGLGGRLDAVNVVDADVAVVTSVDIDHMDYLGPTREDIGREKAGIFRAGRPAVCARARSAGAARRRTRARSARRCCAIGRDYGYVAEGTQWRYWGPGGARYGLPYPGAARRVPARATRRRRSRRSTCCATACRSRAGAIRDGLLDVELPGRFQVLPGRPDDRARRRAQPARGARAGRRRSATMGYHPRDARGVRHARRQGHRRRRRGGRGRASTAGTSRRCPVRAARAPTRCATRSRARASRRARSARSTTSRTAFAAARDDAGEADRIVVFGSFLTVAAALAATSAANRRTRRTMAERIADNRRCHRRRTEAQARRRLVGAVVLALGAAVIVPMLLEKEPKPLGDDVSVQIPPVDDGKFVNRLTGKRARTREPPPKPSRDDADAAKRSRSRAPSAPRRRRHAGRRRAASRRTTPRPCADRGAPAPKKSLADAEQRSSRREPRRAAPTRRRAAPKAEDPRRADAAAPARTEAGAPSRRAPSRSRRRKAAQRRRRRRGDAGEAEGFVVQLAAFADDKGANALAEQAEEERLRRVYRAGRDHPRHAVARARRRLRIAPRGGRRARDKLKGEGYSGIVAPAQVTVPHRRCVASTRTACRR